MQDTRADEIGSPQQTPGEPGDRVARPRRLPLPALTALVVVALCLGAALVVRAGHDDSPAGAAAARLHLVYGASGTGVRDWGVRDAAGSSAAAPGAGPVLSGRLPDGPDTARVHRLPDGRAYSADVARLARALGVAGEPRRSGGGWVVGTSPRQLVVRDAPGLPWSYGQGDCAVSSDGTVSCLSPDATSGSGGGSSGGSVSGSTGSTGAPDADEAAKLAAERATGRPWTGPPVSPLRCVKAPCPYAPRDLPGSVTTAPPAPPAPDPALVRRAATEVFADVGLADAAVRVVTAGSVGTVVADPVIGGRRTVGFSTALTYEAPKDLVSGNGWLGVPREGAAYPLVSARTAFDQLAAGAPRALTPMTPGTPVTPIAPMTKDMPCDAVAGRAPLCAEAPRVTGAELGLLLTSDVQGEQLLVPAWLFDVAGADEPLAVVAVKPEIAYDPTAQKPDEPAPSEKPVQPPASEPAPADGLHVEASPASRELVVVGWGGIPECYDFTASAKESDETVVLSVAQAPRGTKACIDLAVERRASVVLDAPLGDRQVLDASGARIPVTPTARRAVGTR